MRNSVIKPLDAETGRLEILADDQTLSARDNPSPALDCDRWGSGRELFAGRCALVTGAEDGAAAFRMTERMTSDD